MTEAQFSIDRRSSNESCGGVQVSGPASRRARMSTAPNELVAASPKKTALDGPMRWV